MAFPIGQIISLVAGQLLQHAGDQGNQNGMIQHLIQKGINKKMNQIKTKSQTEQTKGLLNNRL